MKIRSMFLLQYSHTVNNDFFCCYYIAVAVVVVVVVVVVTGYLANDRKTTLKIYTIRILWKNPENYL